MLVDSSAWIEFLRGTDSKVCRQVDDALASELMTTDPVVMELVAGALRESELGNVQALLGRTTMVRCEPDDYLAAANLFRMIRLEGVTIRNVLDCLIASVAIRAEVPILTADRDFEVIARYSTLQLAT